MIKVFKVGDLIKYSAKIVVAFVVMFFLIQFFVSKGNNVDKKDTAFLFCINDRLPQLKINKVEDDNKKKDIDGLKYAFVSELEIFNSVKIETEKNEDIIDNNNVTTNQETKGQEENNITLPKEGQTVSEVINSGVNPRSTDDFEGVLINNSTNYTLTYDMLNPNIEVNKKKILMYHTHTCESYTPTEACNYEASGTFRTIDLNYSVAGVGDELVNQLKQYSIEVVHDKTYHDYPAYNGSYSRSLVTAKSLLSSNSDADIVIDLHRDAIADGTYAPKVKIGEEYAAQLMFVIGSDGANSAHTNWLQNLKFAIKVQKKANELYPGLFKPIIFRNSEYNQHVAKAACIIEVGATGNTLEEAKASMKYLAKILDEI